MKTPFSAILKRIRNTFRSTGSWLRRLFVPMASTSVGKEKLEGIRMRARTELERLRHERRRIVERFLKVVGDKRIGEVKKKLKDL